MFERPLIYEILGLIPRARLAESKLRMTWSSAEVNDYQLRKLNALFRRFERCTDSLRLPYASIALAGPFSSLADFSERVGILEKWQVQERIGQARPRRIGMSVLRETAGTSGRVTRVSISRDVLSAQLVARALSLAWHCIVLGEREGRVWGRAGRRRNVTLMERLLNRRVVGKLESAAERAIAVKFLAAFDPIYLYGYSSHMLSIASELGGMKSEFSSLKAAFCTAESLLESERKSLQSRIGVPVFREYGCTEVDIIASECSKQRYHVMIDRCLVEVLGDAGSGEVLVTDLDNFDFPLIRYRLGDIVRLDVRGCECGLKWPVIADIEGRTSNRYVALGSGKRVHAVTFAHMAESMCEIGIGVRQFRVTQEAFDALTVHLDLERSDQFEAASRFVRNWIARELHEDVAVNVSSGPIQVLYGLKNHYFQPMSSSGP